MPRANGQVERYNRTIVDAAATMSANLEEEDWDENISKIQLAINSTFNKTIQTTPSEVLVEFQLNLGNDRYVTLVHDPLTIDVKSLDVAKRLEENRERQNKIFNMRRKTVPVYKIGDLVLVKVTNFKNDGNSKKLVEKYKGSFKIKQNLGNDR
nr:uncharacterized protein LOC111512178 [Leptinotarsa decemlineata]